MDLCLVPYCLDNIPLACYYQARVTLGLQGTVRKYRRGFQLETTALGNCGQSPRVVYTPYGSIMIFRDLLYELTCR